VELLELVVILPFLVLPRPFQGVQVPWVMFPDTPKWLTSKKMVKIGEVTKWCVRKHHPWHLYMHRPLLPLLVPIAPYRTPSMYHPTNTSMTSKTCFLPKPYATKRTKSILPHYLVFSACRCNLSQICNTTPSLNPLWPKPGPFWTLPNCIRCFASAPNFISTYY